HSRDLLRRGTPGGRQVPLVADRVEAVAVDRFARLLRRGTAEVVAGQAVAEGHARILAPAERHQDRTGGDQQGEGREGAAWRGHGFHGGNPRVSTACPKRTAFRNWAGGRRPSGSMQQRYATTL